MLFRVIVYYKICPLKSSEHILILWYFLQRPAHSFINAAKQCSVDNLCGTLDAIAWGKEPSIGTSGSFKLMYSGKVCIVTALLDLGTIFSRGSSMPSQK